MVKCNYVINLTRRPDRLQRFLKNKDETCLKDEEFIIFSAFDGLDYENEVKRFGIENHLIFQIMKHHKINAPKGVLGCLLSHLLVLQEIVQNTNIDENDYVGIYEDDVFYCDDFNEKYNEYKKINWLNYNADFIYTGGRFEKEFDCRKSFDFNLMFEKTDTPKIIKRNYMIYRNFNWDRCTSSYVIRKSICKKLIETIISSFLTIENQVLRFEAIDYVYTCAYDKFNMFDYVPHLFFSDLNYESDIQGNNLRNVIHF